MAYLTYNGKYLRYNGKMLVTPGSTADNVSTDWDELNFDGTGLALDNDTVYVTSSGTWTTTLVNTGDGTTWASRNPTSGCNGITCTVTVTTYEGLGRSCILRFTCGSAQADVTINQVGFV